MNTYISLLKGINVGGQKIIKMDALRSTCEKLGFQNVWTYVQSGNVIFNTPQMEKDELADRISRQIKLDFGLDVSVVVLTKTELEQIVNENLILENNEEKSISSMYVTFFSSIPDVYDSEVIESRKQQGDEVFISDKAVYLYCPNGYGSTKLTNSFFENQMKVTATTRNWKTTNELLKIADSISL